MAVYKATYCYPFKNNLDPRVVVSEMNDSPELYIKCKIETSNKNVTGYSIKILDENNNRVFPATGEEKISPISELKSDNSTLVNTGINGSFLEIPLIQNLNSIKVSSYNNIYYKPKHQAMYVIGTYSLGMQGSDNITYWTYDSTAQTLSHDKWDGSLNNDLVVVGDRVAVLSTNDSAGIYVVQEDGYLLKVVSATNLRSNGARTVITQGEYHNNIFYWDGDANSFKPIGDESVWVDIDNNKINLDAEGKDYKWVITLYQGTEYREKNRVFKYYTYTTELPTPTESDLGKLYGIVAAKAIFRVVAVEGEEEITYDYELTDLPFEQTVSLDYSNISADWYDNILTSGTILGSTVSRLQLSSMTPENSGGDYLPGEGGSEVLILQNRFVQLFNTQHLVGTRKYIEHYDSTFGHVYPMANSVLESELQEADYCVFYKHGNDEEHILEGDIVEVATTANITLSGLQTIDGITLKENDIVLVKNQTTAELNGVYLAHSGAWTRSGSYASWSSFIGKVIFVRKGSANGQKNFMSLANAGGTLYNTETVIGHTGDSPLFFREEEPILLFPQLIYKHVDLATVEDESPALPTTTSVAIDGCNVTRSGITVIHNASIYKSVVTGFSVAWNYVESVSKDKTYYIEQGSKCGHRCIKYVLPEGGSSLDYTWDEYVYAAYICKNTTTKTYISPYNMINKNMILKLNHEFITSNNETKHNLKIISVNKKFNYITHEQLATPFLSYSAINKDIPYNYNLCSFFKESDENPFSCYESPYLRISTNGHGYSNITQYQDLIVQAEHYSTLSAFPEVGVADLVYIADDTGYSYNYKAAQGSYVLTDPQVEDNGFYLVWARDGGSRQHFAFPSASITAIAQRFIKLEGLYKQAQCASWESYRWVLTDSTGEILQDTGKCYDKEMKTTFYGLTNTDKKVYYAILYVEDSLNNDLSLSLRFIVDSSDMSSTNVPFDAWYDCNTQSVCLKLENMSYIKPVLGQAERGRFSPEDSSLYTVAFIRGNPYLDSAFDDSVWYSNDAMQITSQKESFIVYTFNGKGSGMQGSGSGSLSIRTSGSGSGSRSVRSSGITSTGTVTSDMAANDWSAIVPTQDLYTLDNHLSLSNEYGIVYNNYFSLDQSRISKNSQPLALLDDDQYEAQSSNYDPKNGVGCLDTMVVLHDNFCGKFLEFTLEGPWSVNRDQGIIFNLEIPYDFSGNDPQRSGSLDSLSSDRNKIFVDIQKYDGSVKTSLKRYKFLKSSTEPYTWMDIDSIQNRMYYLQPEIIPGALTNKNNVYEFLHYTSVFDESYALNKSVVDSESFEKQKAIRTLYEKQEDGTFIAVTTYTEGEDYYNRVPPLQPWYSSPGIGYAINSDLSLNTLININEEVISGTENNANIGINFGDEKNNSEWSKNAAAYWRDKGLKFHMLSCPKFNNKYTNVVEDSFTNGGYKDKVMYWPSEDDEMNYYMNETPDTTYKTTSGVDSVPLTWEDFMNVKQSRKVGVSDKLPVRLLVGYSRHPGQLSLKSFRIIIRVYDAISIYSNALPIEIVCTSENVNEVRINNKKVASIEIIQDTSDAEI